MFWAATISVNTGVTSIFLLSFAARTESMSLMSAFCCSILSSLPRLKLRKKTLNSFVQSLNSTGVASLVNVSGFRSVLILTLSATWDGSTQTDVASLGARSRHSCWLHL